MLWLYGALCCCIDFVFHTQTYLAWKLQFSTYILMPLFTIRTRSRLLVINLSTCYVLGYCLGKFQWLLRRTHVTAAPPLILLLEVQGIPLTWDQLHLADVYACWELSLSIILQPGIMLVFEWSKDLRSSSRVRLQWQVALFQVVALCGRE